MMIAQFEGEDQRKLDKHWPELMLSVNSSVSDSTGYLYAVLCNTRERVRLPREI